jgi:hypothetical protein
VTAVVGASSEVHREDAIASGLQAQVRGRPVGEKRSKRARDGEAEEEPNSLAVISSSIADYTRTNSLRTKSMEESRRISSRAITLQTQTAAFETLYNAPNAVATEEERRVASTLLHHAFFASFEQADTRAATILPTALNNDVEIPEVHAPFALCLGSDGDDESELVVSRVQGEPQPDET